MSAGVGGDVLALWLGLRKYGKKRRNNPALDHNADVLY